MVRVDKPYVDIFTRLEPVPEKKPKKGESEYDKFKKEELVKMLDERDFQASQRFKQDPSAIDAVTSMVAAPVGEEPTGSGMEELAAIFRELINDQRIEMMTDLRPAQIRAFARAWWICKLYEYEAGQGFLISMLKFAVSKDRKGRLEFIKAIGSAPPMMGGMGGGLEGEEEMPSSSKIRSLLSRWG